MARMKWRAPLMAMMMNRPKPIWPSASKIGCTPMRRMTKTRSASPNRNAMSCAQKIVRRAPPFDRVGAVASGSSGVPVVSLICSSTEINVQSPLGL